MVFGAGSYLLDWGRDRGCRCDGCDVPRSGLQVLWRDAKPEPLPWLAPAGIGLLASLTYFSTGKQPRCSPGPALLPLATLAVGLWTLGLFGTTARMESQYAGFYVNLVGFTSAAAGGLSIAWGAGQPECRSTGGSVRSSLCRWAILKALVAAGLLLAGQVAAASCDDGWLWMETPIGIGRRVYEWSGDWSAATRFTIGAVLVAYSAAMTCGFAFAPSRQSVRPTALFRAWLLFLVPSLCAWLVYASGIVTIFKGPLGAEALSGTPLMAAIVLDLAVAPLLLWCAILREDRQALESHLAGGAAIR